MAAKEQDKELSREHVDDLRNRYSRFCERFGESGTRTLTSKEVQEWLWSLPLTAQSKNNFRARLFALFNFAVAREYMDKNLCAAIKPLKIRKAKKEIFTPDELRAVLDHASPEILPAIVIGAFAGVRTKERTLLTWEDLDIKRGKLTVGAEDSKTAARHTITMEECLKAWLAPFNGRSGPIFDGTDMRFCQKLSKICKAAGLKKAPKNGLRHSFASYHVAKYQDAERVRGDLGHTTANLLFATYREMVQPEDADRWFSIFPPQQAQNVVSLSAA
jgi:integrase